MSELDAIGLKFGSDKASSIHNYLYFYEKKLAYLRNERFTMFEIGVYRGGSVKMWEEFFPNAIIVGLDIDPETRRFESGRIKVRIGDQSDVRFVFETIKEFGPPRFVIDDGSHRWDHQIQTLQFLLPFVEARGTYILEDLQTSSEKLAGAYRGVSAISAFDYLSRLTRLLVVDDANGPTDIEDNFVLSNFQSIESIEFIRRSAIIRKRG